MDETWQKSILFITTFRDWQLWNMSRPAAAHIVQLMEQRESERLFLPTYDRERRKNFLSFLSWKRCMIWGIPVISIISLRGEILINMRVIRLLAAGMCPALSQKHGHLERKALFITAEWWSSFSLSLCKSVLPGLRPLSAFRPIRGEVQP